MTVPDALAGLILGTLASVCWGVADFIARGASRKVGEHLTLLGVLAVGAVGVGGYALPRGLESVDGRAALLITVTALITLVGYLALYRAFRVGMLSVASGIASCNAIIPVILALVLLGERPLPWQYAGIVLVLAGVVLLSMRGFGRALGRQAPQGQALGVAPALTAMTLFGLGLFGMKLCVSAAGPTTVALAVRVIGVAALGAWLLAGGRLAMPPREVRGALIAAGLLDAAAFVFFCEALTRTLLSLVAPISSTIPVVTVALAYFLLHERLRPNQWAGLAMAVTGIALVAAG